MSTSSWTMVVGAAAGLGLAAFGVKILVTGRMPRSTARAFRSVHDAGLYHLLFGLALALVTIGTALAGSVLPTVTAVIGILLAAIAVIRFRPRPGENGNEAGRHKSQD